MARDMGVQSTWLWSLLPGWVTLAKPLDFWEATVKFICTMKRGIGSHLKVLAALTL